MHNSTIYWLCMAVGMFLLGLPSGMWESECHYNVVWKYTDSQISEI